MAMLRIGDLARLGAVSVRMLRHYHEIGLLVPAEVDDRTGYRRYDASQLDEHGHRTVGYSRELDIECGPDREWVTELQFALET